MITPFKEVYPGHMTGLMTQHEKKKLKNISTPHNKFWVPTMWFSTLVTQCREEGRIRDDIHLKTLLDEVTNFKTSLGMLYSFDWISIPLVYTQVATMAVYGFFFACLMGRQYVEGTPENGHNPISADLYFPLFTLMQFFFYMGWLKVAEVLINPFGEDEDDFEINWMIDRNYQVAMLAGDEMYNDIPILEKDMYWDELEPELPYTKSTICHKNEPFMGSTADFSLDSEDTQVVGGSAMETIPENAPAKNGSHLDIPTTVNTTSTVSSPARFRHFFNNITNAFSQESIADSRKDLHTCIKSLHNVKDGIRDPHFYQSPVLQRIRSNSFKRSHSHTENLSPKRMGSMYNVHVVPGHESHIPHGSHVVNIPTSDVPLGHTNPTMVPSPLLLEDGHSEVEVHPIDGGTVCSGIVSRRQSVHNDPNMAPTSVHRDQTIGQVAVDSSPNMVPASIHTDPNIVLTPTHAGPNMVITPVHTSPNMVLTPVHNCAMLPVPAHIHTRPNTVSTPIHTTSTMVPMVPTPASLHLKDLGTPVPFMGKPDVDTNAADLANGSSVWDQFGCNTNCGPITESSPPTPSSHPIVFLGNDPFHQPELPNQSQTAYVWDHSNADLSSFKHANLLPVQNQIHVAVEPETLSINPVGLPFLETACAPFLESADVPLVEKGDECLQPSVLGQGSKGDSQESLDSTGSTYDSSYDTVSSQQPLLEAARCWKEDFENES